MGSVNGKSNNPKGRPKLAINEDLRKLISGDVKANYELIRDAISGKEKTTVVVGGKLREIPLSLKDRCDMAMRLFNKVLPDLKAQEITGQMGLTLNFITNVPDIE